MTGLFDGRWTFTMLLIAEALVWFVVVMVVHETGHLAAARWRGYPARMTLRWLGPGVRWGSDDVVATPRDRAAVALAGPAASLALAAVLAIPANTETVDGMLWLGAMLISLLVTVQNLIPLGPSDGKHALDAVRRKRA